VYNFDPFYLLFFLFTFQSIGTKLLTFFYCTYPANAVFGHIEYQFSNNNKVPIDM